MAYRQLHQAAASSGGTAIGSGVTLSPVRLLQVRLRQQEDRCQALQRALKEQQQHSLSILQGKSGTRNPYESSISKIPHKGLRMKTLSVKSEFYLKTLM